jgi:hypothetical protein
LIWDTMRLNFVVDKFFIWNYLESQNIFKFMDFQTKNFQNNLKWWGGLYQSCSSQYNLQLCSLKVFYLGSFRVLNIVNTKIVVADLIYIFVIDKFFIWSCLVSQMFALNSHILRFNFLNFPNNIEWRHIL